MHNLYHHVKAPFCSLLHCIVKALFFLSNYDCGYYLSVLTCINSLHYFLFCPVFDPQSFKTKWKGQKHSLYGLILTLYLFLYLSKWSLYYSLENISTFYWWIWVYKNWLSQFSFCQETMLDPPPIIAWKLSEYSQVAWCLFSIGR